jgi:hypothetical protein
MSEAGRHGRPTARRHGSRRIAAVLGVALVTAGAVGLLAPAAKADGPGYGGGADKLAVAWTDQPPTTAAGLPVTGGGTGRALSGAGSSLPDAVATDDIGLAVTGVGFRGLSSVDVRVGAGDPFSVRVDDTGTLRIQAPASSSDSVSSGTSVVAVGRAPSGTTKTLVGSVPPRPNGTGPVDLVPWVALVLGLGFVGTWIVGRTRGKA